MMKLINIISILLICTILSNCTPARITKDHYPTDVKTSKVKISRDSTILFAAVPAIFGYDEKDKVSLWKGGESELKVAVGQHEFFVRSNQADRPFTYSVEVKENEPLCLAIHPEPKPVIKFIIPLVFYFSHAFKIEASSDCR